MKLYRYTCGDHDKLGVAEDEQDAYERRTEVDPSFHYLPVVVEEMKLDGYEITVKSTDGTEASKRGGRKAQA
jgi:hypothetical protein